ncbi:MAG: NAD-dependent epimerase/dehydratase family protein [Candidatus Daviesbacteria bacterium]|nr:NAD-dependent epimerase/dehydratase family protein [Candidatus Daviesbacteria bacterium]
MKRVLVTGSSGFVGSHLVSSLNLKGYDIVRFSRKEKKNVLNTLDFENIGDIDIVFHLAAIANVPLSWEIPKDVLETNIMGTLNVLSFAKKKKAKIIFANSYVYGVPQYLPIDEKHPLSAENPYAVSKISAESLCQIYSKRFGLSVTSFRFFNIYGPGQAENMVISQMIKQLKSEGGITIMDSKPKRDFVFIDDVVKAYILAAESNSNGFEIFNIGSGRSFSIKEIANNLLNIAGVNPDKLLDNNHPRPNDIAETLADITKAKNVLHWEPMVSFQDGLERTFNTLV